MFRYDLTPFTTIQPMTAYTARTLPDRRRRRRVVGVPHPPGHPRLQRPELDEPGGRVLGKEPAGLGEGRELGVVDRVRGLARDDAREALVELQPDRARDLLVDTVHVGVEVGAQRLPPEPGVHEVRPLLVELGLEAVLVD